MRMLNGLPPLQYLQTTAYRYRMILNTRVEKRAFIITLHEVGAFGAADRDLLLGLV